MAIANGIFKQLIYVPEGLTLGTMTADDTAVLATAATNITTAVTGIGKDEIDLTYNGSITGTSIPKGTKISFGNNPTVFYTVTATATLVGSAVTVTLDDSLSVATTALTTATLSYAAKNVTPRMLRRVTSNIDLKKASYSSNEIRTDAQLADFRHGGVSVEGSINGELSGRTYQELMGAVLRKDFATSISKSITTGATIASTTITGVDAGTAAVITFASANDLVLTGSASTALRTGDVIWFETIGGTYATNALCPLLVLDINTTTNAIVVVPVAKPANWTAVTTLSTIGVVKYEVLGKKSYIPLTGHTKYSFQFEHFYKDISPTTTGAGSANYPQSEIFVGCRPTQMAIKLPATGLATCDFTIMGQRMKTPSDYTTQASWEGQKSILQNVTSEAPIDSAIDPIFSAAVGSIYMKDKATNAMQKVGLITAFDYTVNGNGSKADVVGSDQTPDIFLGKLSVSGNLSIYFQDTVWRDVFYKEQEASLIAVFTSNSVGDSSTKFMSMVMPRIKTGGASKDDGDKGLIMTVPFTALLGDGTSVFEATTLQIQDFS
jgi:hypothetical protein